MERSYLDRRAGLAPALAAVAGYVDAVGYLSLNVFTAHMSGNSARLGVYLSHHGWHDALVVVFAVAVFVASIAAGTLIMELGARGGRTHTDALLLLVEAALLAVFAVVGQLSQVQGRIPSAPAVQFYGLVACAVCAIGLQTASLQRISGQPVRTAFVSGMLTALADEIVGAVTQPHAGRGKRSYLADELGMRGRPQPGRALLIAFIWLGYVGGATGGAFLQRSWHLMSLVLPIALLVAVAAATRRLLERSSPGH